MDLWVTFDTSLYDEHVKEAFFGEYHCKLDAKCRLRLPSSMIRQLGGSSSLKLVINRGFEQCLILYPNEIWGGIVKELSKLNVYDKEHRAFLRFFYRGATEVSPDNSDRILVPKSLKEYCKINKEVIISPLHNRFEIWPTEIYETLYEKEPINFSDLAQRVLGTQSEDE